MNKSQRGEILEPILILIGLLIIIFLFVLPIGPDIDNDSSKGSIWKIGSNRRDRDTTDYSKDHSRDSLYDIDVDLGRGNSGQSVDATEEYITLRNRGDYPISITGWFLTNAKGTKSYTLNGRLLYEPSDQATIPQGTLLLTPNGQNVLGPIVLNENETAIVTSGYVGQRSNIPIVSFKVNKCTGYLESDAEYKFTPSLRRSCAQSEDEPGYYYLDEKCKDYIDGMGTCHIPDFETRDLNGESCRNCVDGRRGLSGSCVAFLKEHYNYAGCLAYHSQDQDFLGKEWRVFLGRTWEMWADDDETITLFDQFGKTIDYLSY